MKALRAFLAVAALCLFGTEVFALDVPARPSPGVRVVDLAQVFRGSEKHDLEVRIAALEEKTTAQVVVLTVPSLKGDDVFSFAQRVFDVWKPGQKKQDNGLLIVLAKAERKLRIHTGYGLEGPIPDATALDLGQLMRSELRQDKYYDAFVKGVDGIANLIAGEPVQGLKHSTGDSRIWWFLVPFIVAGFIAAIDTWQARLVAGCVCGALSGGIAWILFVTATAALIAAAVGFVVGLIADVFWRIGFDFGGAVLGGGASGGGGISLDF